MNAEKLKKGGGNCIIICDGRSVWLSRLLLCNAVEEPVEPKQEETTTTAPQEQEEVPTAEEETPQQQEEEQQQPAVEEEQPAAEEAQPQPQPVEQAEVKVSYVKEDDTDLMESVTATYDVGYRLDQDTNVFKEAHEAFEFEYAFVNGNKENKITKDQVKASGLTVTSDMTSLTLVYKSTATQNEAKIKRLKQLIYLVKRKMILILRMI